MNDEREEEIEYSRRNAELRMINADLWIQDPSFYMASSLKKLVSNG